MLDSLRWLDINQRLKYNIACLVWKIKNDQVPEYLKMFTNCSEVHSYNTRSAHSGDIHQAPCHHMSLKYSGATIWKQLPPELKGSTHSYHSFKKGLIAYLRG